MAHFRSYKNAQIFAYDGVEATEERPRHDGMADRHFVKMRKRPKHREVVEIEIVAGIHAKAERVRRTRGAGVGLKRAAGGVRTALERAGEWLGVELHAVGAERGRELNGRIVRINKQADAGARAPSSRR